MNAYKFQAMAGVICTYITIDRKHVLITATPFVLLIARYFFFNLIDI